jgi:hypothetical protein
MSPSTSTSTSPSTSPSHDLDSHLTFAFSRAIIARGGSSDAVQDGGSETFIETAGLGPLADDGAAEAVIAAAASVAEVKAPTSPGGGVTDI